MNIFDIMGPIMVGTMPQPMSHGPGTPHCLHFLGRSESALRQGPGSGPGHLGAPDGAARFRSRTTAPHCPFSYSQQGVFL